MVNVHVVDRDGVASSPAVASAVAAAAERSASAAGSCFARAAPNRWSG